MAGCPTSQGRLGRKKRLGSNNRRRDMQLQVPWLKPAAWRVGVGAAAAMIIGFSWLGWTLGSTAERVASGRTPTAGGIALTPSRVTGFVQRACPAAKPAELQEPGSGKCGEFLRHGAAATRRGAKPPTRAV